MASMKGRDRQRSQDVLLMRILVWFTGLCGDVLGISASFVMKSAVVITKGTLVQMFTDMASFSVGMVRNAVSDRVMRVPFVFCFRWIFCD